MGECEHPDAPDDNQTKTLMGQPKWCPLREEETVLTAQRRNPNMSTAESTKEKAKKIAKGVLDFSTRAVFYVPYRKDHLVVKVLKGAALLHSAYAAYKGNEDGEPNAPATERPVPEESESGTRPCC